MEGNYLTAGDLALYEQNRRGWAYGCDGYGHHYKQRNSLQGASITGVVLGGAALVGVVAAAWGVNAASKARARGAENVAASNAKTVEMLAGVVTREANRNDSINLDVNQTLRSLAGASGGSASSNALATAEALAILQNNNGGVNSAIGGCNYLRVARVSGSRLCGCDNCEG